MVDRWRSNSLSRWRAGLSLASLFLFLLFGMLFPFPIRHHGLGQLKAKGQYPVYALESGFLRASDATSLKSRKVLQGEYLASLDNPILEETVLRAQEHREMLSHAMQAAQRATFLDSQEMDQLPTLASMLAIAEKQWEVRVESWNRLQMLAPKEGMWYGNDSVSLNFEERFSPWGRTTFGEAITLGSLIPQGTLLGWIESRKGWEIELPLPETKISEVFEGMRCRVRLLQRPYDVFEGTVTHVAVQSSHEFQTGSDPSGPFGSGVGRSESSTTGNWPEVGKNGDSGQSVQYVVAVSLDSQEDLELALSGGAAEVVLWGRAKCMAQRALEWSHRNLKVR